MENKRQSKPLMQQQIVDYLESNGIDFDDQGREYSGRNMYGQKSLFAIVVHHGPTSKIGKDLCHLGMTFDNMGFDYIYYLE